MPLVSFFKPGFVLVLGFLPEPKFACNYYISLQSLLCIYNKLGNWKNALALFHSISVSESPEDVDMEIPEPLGAVVKLQY